MKMPKMIVVNKIKNLVRRSIILTSILIILLLFSSCNGLKPSMDNGGVLQQEYGELEKLKNQNNNLNVQIEQLQSEKKSLQSQLDNLHSVWSADLTEDGINETITGPPQPAPSSLFEYGGALMVESADGDILLDEKSGILGVAGVYNVGAKTPVLITLQWGGGSMGDYYGAYLFDPADNKLKKILWDNYEFAIGSLDNSKCEKGSIVIKNRGTKLESTDEYQPFYQRWIYKNGQMVSVEKWETK